MENESELLNSYSLFKLFKKNSKALGNVEKEYFEVMKEELNLLKPKFTALSNQYKGLEMILKNFESDLKKYYELGMNPKF